MDYIGEKELNNKLDDFKNHLKHADRMILSAKFGDGKSFFLQKIREDKERFAEYEFITIYPVNYVVAQNDDIFEYIKRDILIQLVKLNLIEKIDLEKLLTSVFSFDSFKEVLFFLISSIPQYGPIIKKLLDKAISISEKYNDEKNTYEKYFDSFTVQRGGLYEDDAYTQMIKEAINLLKVGYINEKGELPQKKPVLIIEDLDRLDPAHLFRILNVISAHIDDVNKPDKIRNKFGFSNIVIVMDYDTTKHIFEHFYGKNASYEGYMSKFLAEEPFKYSIIELAIAKLKTKLSEEIGIDILFTNSLSILNLKIASFSMRDIVRIYDFDVHHRIKQNQYEVSDKLCLSTSLPIFKLILYMIEFGMSIGDIQEDLSYHVGYNVKEYIKLVFPLYAMEKKKKNKVFNLETDLIEARLEFSQNLATSVSVGYPEFPEFQTGNSPSFSKEMRLSIINDIFCMNRHIDIASLNVNVGFTIPNYKSLI